MVAKIAKAALKARYHVKPMFLAINLPYVFAVFVNCADTKYHVCSLVLCQMYILFLKRSKILTCVNLHTPIAPRTAPRAPPHRTARTHARTHARAHAHTHTHTRHFLDFPYTFLRSFLVYV